MTGAAIVSENAGIQQAFDGHRAKRKFPIDAIRVRREGYGQLRGSPDGLRVAG